jgi:hypothetical protein
VGLCTRAHHTDPGDEHDDVNPIAASLLAAALIGEPLTLNLALGVVAVASGIWIASTA